MNKFMRLAIDEAQKGIRAGDGGPFGAVVVCNGRVVVSGHNEVVATKDPTAHAEIVVIREASRRLGRFDLSDCELYTTCEPCPMCRGAVHWARLNRVYYGCTRDDAASIGFDDALLYRILRGDDENQQTRFEIIDEEECREVFAEYKGMEGAVRY